MSGLSTQSPEHAYLGQREKMAMSLGHGKLLPVISEVERSGMVASWSIEFISVSL